MQIGSLMIIFYALSTLTTGILQGLGQMKQPLINCSISLAMHFVLLYILLTRANLNIYAVVYANIFFALVVCILNARSIRRYIHYRQEWYKTFFVPAVASIIMAAAVHVVYAALHTFAGNTFSTIVAIVIGVMVYGIGLVTFKGITIEEVATFPKGHLIIKLLRRLGLFR
jgi:stage V sporulation protein B